MYAFRGQYQFTIQNARSSCHSALENDDGGAVRSCDVERILLCGLQFYSSYSHKVSIPPVVCNFNGVVAIGSSIGYQYIFWVCLVECYMLVKLAHVSCEQCPICVICIDKIGECSTRITPPKSKVLYAHVSESSVLLLVLVVNSFNYKTCTEVDMKSLVNNESSVRNPRVGTVVRSCQVCSGCCSKPRVIA